MSAPIDRYQEYEIAPCIPVAVNNGITCYERIETLRGLTKKERAGLIWSLYGWRRGVGVDCIGDFEKREYAIEVYGRITGYAVPKNWRKPVLTGLPA